MIEPPRCLLDISGFSPGSSFSSEVPPHSGSLSQSSPHAKKSPRFATGGNNIENSNNLRLPATLQGVHVTFHLSILN